MHECTEAVFLKDVSKHKMEVLLDNGIYRHLRFKGEPSWNQSLNVVTWPGRLAYTGDMGTFVFARLEDMFQFFRTRPSGDPAKLYINTGYWGEKLEAIDRDHRNSSERAFSADLFREKVEEHVAEWIEEYSLTETEQQELRADIEDEVLRFDEDGEHEARRALSDFSAIVGEHEFQFQDTWEWDLREYTFRFVWCCYAIAWAIRQYDAKQHEPEAALIGLKKDSMVS